MNLDFPIRPISDRTAFTGPPAAGSRNPFDADWSSTSILLNNELYYLDAKSIVVELDVREQDIRVDGQLRANVTTMTPAVRIAFESMHGPLVYATDRFGWRYDDRPYADGWKQNIRAIALGLEALRKVDRYGITRAAEQYRGFKAIGAGGDGLVASGMTVETAIEILNREGEILDLGSPLRERVRRALFYTHPDRNHGDRSRFDAVDQAVQVLQRAGRLS